MQETSVNLVTGYYRFTDIIFEWHQVLPNKDDAGPLKALIAFDALVHPDHPLRKPGQAGIELYQGVFENGEARLLFSSAQVEYIRYYLHAMGQVNDLLPLPASEYLIRKGDLKSCAPAYYSDSRSLKTAVKSIDKINKRLRGLGGDKLLGLRRMDFERVRSYWAAQEGTWIAVDFESWEWDHTLLLESGWSLVRWDQDAAEVSETGHLIVKSRMNYQNGNFVEGNRDHYNFGQSEMVDRQVFKERINSLISEAKERGPLFLVFHDASQDVKDLQGPSIQAPLQGLSYILPDATPSSGVFVVDTADLFAALEGNSGGNTRGLQRVCNQLQIGTEYMHNAGNDAHYTMLALRSMATGGPLDVQRQRRWPAYISTNGLGVNLPGMDNNPNNDDDDDVEEIEGPNANNIIAQQEGVVETERS